MAPIPHHWMKKYLSSKRAQPVKPATSKSGTPPPPKTKAPKAAKPQAAATTRSRQRPGFFRSMAGAIAGEVLKGTGAIGNRVVRKIGGLHEMDGAGGLGGTPVNNASSGAVAGLGTGSQEPGVKKKTKAPMLSYKMFKRSKDIKK
jgi:hypothetical protein